MELKKVHLGTTSFSSDMNYDISFHFKSGYRSRNGNFYCSLTLLEHYGRGKKTKDAFNSRPDLSAKVYFAVLSLALCHNVTPTVSEENVISYQASSPDEIALVQWTATIGLTVIYRDASLIKLKMPDDVVFEFDILDIFPFTSESKRMGIIVREKLTSDIYFIQKGADSVMSKNVERNDWLEEECGNMAREGLRTLVVAKKSVTAPAFAELHRRLIEARTKIGDSSVAVAKIVAEFLEKDLELLCLTGVEDRLQDDVKITLEILRNAGLGIWMLTGIFPKTLMR
jgi:phospholipid-translocating ATPase